MKHVKHPLQLRVEKMLKRYGGFYNFQDILKCIADGAMQSFVLGDSWAVTQVLTFPRKTVLNVVFVVGTLEELELLSADLEFWAKERGIEYGMANGRSGWTRKAFPGWKLTSATFVKDFSNGS